MTVSGEILERLAALDAELGALPERLLQELVAQAPAAEQERGELPGAAFAALPALTEPAASREALATLPPLAEPTPSRPAFAALPALAEPAASREAFAALPPLSEPGGAPVRFPEAPAPEAARSPASPFGELPVSAGGGGGMGGGSGSDAGGEIMPLLERMVEQLTAIAEKLDRPVEAPAVGAPLPSGNVGWSASWSAEGEGTEDSYPASSPSVNVSARAGNRGAGGYGFGSSWGQPKSDFYEPGRRRPGL